MKINWVKTYYENIEIQILANQSFKYKDEFFWHGNLAESDIVQLVRPGFWRDVLYAWWKYTYRNPGIKVQVLQQPIWFNSNIKNTQGVLCNKIVKQYGIKLVAHLDSESGNFITYQELCNKSENNISFITYYGIIEAIVPLWKCILKNDSKMGNPH